MSLEHLGKTAGRLLANTMRDVLKESKKASPPVPPKPSSISQKKDSQYPGNVNSGNQYPGNYQQGQPQTSFAPPPLPARGSQPVQSLDMLPKMPDSQGNTIPDFSRVGYREGHVMIPTIPVAMVIQPSPNPCADDTARIQSAIDSVGALPLQSIGEHGAQFRGALLLKAGVYRVAGALIINASGVVIRGEGQDDQGTIVVATGNIQRDFILVNGILTSDMGNVENQKCKAKTKDMMPPNGYKGSRKPATYTQSGVYIPCGSARIPVLDTKGYSVGDKIVIERPGSDEWLCDIGMDCLPCRPDSGKPSTPWTAKTYTFRFERRIVAIEQETSTFIIDIPMVMNLDPKYPPARVYELIHKLPIVSDSGVENMRLVSEWDQKKPEDESHGWYAIVLDNAIDCWVADVTTMCFVSGIFAAVWSRYITIQDCSVLHPVSKPTEGGRRYMYNLSGQKGLVKRCFTNNARHDFITLGRVCGPNVFVDSTGVDGNNDTGPHERFAMGILYDNITCNTLNIRQRGWMGSGQGWAGAFHVVYNCTAHKGNNCLQDPPGVTNWIIGFKGGVTCQPTFEGPCSKMISHNIHVEPRSLYWSQLVARMGGNAQLVESAVGVEAKMQYPPRY
ncbi:hypothetical protein BGZ76_006165 [Entomortierella beljakovae]|nr:hypothetical protein BGZ76_006165 [Entomortierella beljakovae]